MSNYNTRQQHNKITQSISTIYDIKLSKVRHDVAIYEGFKSSNAHMSKLKDDSVQQSHQDPIKPTIDVDSLSEKFLSEGIYFEMYKYDFDNTLILVSFYAPRAIKLILDGHLFKTNKWLSKKVYHMDMSINDWSNVQGSKVNSDDSSRYTTVNCDLYFDNSNVDPRYEFSLGLVQQLMAREFVVDDENLLKHNIDLVKELILGGSIEQYNSICTSDAVVNALRDTGDLCILGERYIEILRELSGIEVDDYKNDYQYISAFFNDRMGFGEIFNGESSRKKLVDLETPPMGSFSESLNENCIEDSVVSELLEGHFPLVDSLFESNPINSLCDNIYKNLGNKDYIMSSYEVAFMKHASFAVKYVCLKICSKSIASDRDECLFIDLNSCLQYYMFLDLDFPEFNEVCRLVPDDNIYENVYFNCDNFDVPYKQFFNSSLLSWVVYNDMNEFSELKEDLKDGLILKYNGLFKTLDRKTLESMVNIELKYCEDDSTFLSEATNIKELLSSSLKKLKES